MNLTIGQLFDVIRLETNTTRTCRVIGLVGTDAAWVWMIDIRSRTALPYKVSKEDARVAIQSGHWVQVSTDRFPASLLAEKDLTEAQKRAVASVWTSLDPLLSHGEVLFCARQRWRIIQEVAEKYHITARTLLTRLRRYWQRGMTRLSVMPDFYNCGKNLSGSRAEQGKKRGRRSPRGAGFVMADIDVTRCRNAYKKHFLKNQKNSLRSAYFKLLKEFYAASRTDDGDEAVVILKPANERPSFAQFRWVVENQDDYTARIQARKGMKLFNKDYRPLHGRGSDISFGPGHIYQIDATPWDITLVSRIDRVPIGKPTLYLVIDVFSHLVVGFNLCLEHVGFDAAATALYCAFTNKVKFAEQHGVTLQPDDWPVQGLPQTVYADRGELIGLAIEKACDHLRVQVANTPPYRADMKPAVEASFRAFNQFFLSTLLGHNRGYMRGHDPVKEAVLDIGQITQLLIKAIIAYNRRVLRDYPIRIHEFSASVPHIPYELWNWGIQNRGGSLRFCGDDTLVPAMLRQENAIATGRGLKFRSLFYLCDAQWMDALRVKSRISATIRVEVAFHEDCVNRIYLKTGQPDFPYVQCDLAEESAVFRNWTFDEVKTTRQKQGLANAEASDEYVQLRADLEEAKQRELEAGKAAAALAPERLKIRDRFAVKEAEAKIERPKNALTGSLPEPPKPPPLPNAGDLLLPRNDLSVFDALEMNNP